MKGKNEKDHRAKKSMGAAELWRKQKKQRNAARGKQVWVPGLCAEGGHWVRITADSKVS